MKFQVPVELAKKHPALTALDMQAIRDNVNAVRKSYPDLEDTDVYKLAFVQFLDSKGIAS